MSEELLHTCGLNRNEQKVLLALVRGGDVPAATLAKRTGLKRTNVYAILDNLLSIGLVAKRPKNGVTWFAAVDPERMTTIFETRARQEYQAVCNAAKVLQPTLSAMATAAPRHFAGFKLNSLESHEGVVALLEELLVGGNFSAIFNPQITIIPEVKDVIVSCLSQSAQSKPPIREIVVAGPMTDWYLKRISNPNHQVKEIPSDKNIFSDMILSDGIVTLLHYEANREVAFRITHDDYYMSMMCVFEMLWDSL